ncbi:helix-turn-helix transcriptional regulator [Microbacteriaceae bacterium 4G12]
MGLSIRSTKDEIISLLKFKNQLTVTELAQELRVTEMAVRRHLSKLEKDNLIKATLVRQSIGRPTYVYELSTKGEDLFPKQYKDFATELLRDLEHMGQEQLIEQLFEARTERMKKQLEKRLVTRQTIGAKLKEIVLVQEQNGYMTEVEAQEDDTFIIKKQNCPLLSVADQFPLLCQCEGKMYQELLPDTDITMISSISSGDHLCMYKIKEKK